MHIEIVRLRDLGESYLEPRRRQSSVLLRGSKVASSLWEPSESRPKSSQHTVSKPFSVLSLQESTKSIGWFVNLVVASSVSDETYFKLRLSIWLISAENLKYFYFLSYGRKWENVWVWFGLQDWFCWKNKKGYNASDMWSFLKLGRIRTDDLKIWNFTSWIQSYFKCTNCFAQLQYELHINPTSYKPNFMPLHAISTPYCKPNTLTILWRRHHKQSLIAFSIKENRSLFTNSKCTNKFSINLVFFFRKFLI